MQRILVTGGTGTLGQEVVRLLISNGYDVSVLSSNRTLFSSQHVRIVQGDLTDLSSLPHNTVHFNTVIHCASNPSNAGLTDIKGTDNLLRWLSPYVETRLIYVSIAGVDQTDYAYYQYKRAAEKLISASSHPWVILRAAQFHDLVLHRIIQPLDNGVTVQVPEGLSFQSIDKRDIVRKIADITVHFSPGNTFTIAGPEILTLEEMVTIYLEVSKRTSSMEPIPPPNAFFSLFTTGINLASDNKYGSITWRSYLNNTLLPNGLQS